MNWGHHFSRPEVRIAQVILMTSNIQQASVSKDFRRVYIMNLKAEPAGKWFCLFCAGSDERRHIKFTVVLARTVNFIWVLEERRDNARMKFWHMSCPRSRKAVQAGMCLHRFRLMRRMPIMNNAGERRKHGTD